MSSNSLAYNKITELGSYSGTPASSDLIPIYDSSTDFVKKLDATKVPVQGATAFSGEADTSDAVLVWDNSASAFATVQLQDIGINSAFSDTIYGNLKLKHHVVTVTLAEVNAGHVLINGVTGKKIYVAHIVAVANGSFAGATSVDVEDSNGTPIPVATYAVAALSDAAVVLPNSANVTPGAGLVTGLTTAADLVVTATGTATTATDVTFSILYSYI